MITTYEVTGMTCGNCAAHITEEVSEIDGVTSVKVDHEAGSMTIESGAAIPFEAVAAAVDEAGDYTVTTS